MGRLLVIVGLIGVVAWWVASRLRSGSRRAADAAPPPPPAPPPRAQDAAPAEMVACAHCGLHLPRADAVADAQGRLFCGDAHRLAGPR